MISCICVLVVSMYMCGSDIMYMCGSGIMYMCASGIDVYVC